MKRKELTGILECFALLLFAAVSWADPVPDTGLTKCYNVFEIPCPSSGQAFYGQDANYSINPMSYTKLDSSGNALLDTATSWVTVRDNVTGLIWENKTGVVGGAPNYSDPHNTNNTYTWYDSNPATNGGNAGTLGNGTTTFSTDDFIRSLNSAHYGGYSDWRMPTVKELAFILNYSIPVPGLKINTTYFPNTSVWGLYWSSTTSAFDTSYAWLVNFYYGYAGNGAGIGGEDKSVGAYVRAVRGGQSGSFDSLGSEVIEDDSASARYTDNGDGTVTDTYTGLTWQKAGSASIQFWEQALAYCEGLNLAGYTDWRLPTIKELRSLADYSRYNPAIDTTNFPDTVSSFYWSSTTYVDDLSYYPYVYGMGNVWGVKFYDGSDNSYGYKYGISYVRAVRGGQPGSFGNLVISPVSQAVAMDAGTTTFSVSNTGTGTMRWSTSIISGSDWLSITSGASGTDTGTINCSFTANTSTSSRTATIRITATGATGSPADVTVTQSSTPPLTGPPTPPPTACTATLDGNFSLHIPDLSYYHPLLETQTYWADFVYEFNPSYPALIPLKLTKYGIINNPSFSCAASTLSSDLKIYIPDVLFPDGITQLWVDLEYSQALSTDGNFYWVVSNHGEVSN